MNEIARGGATDKVLRERPAPGSPRAGAGKPKSRKWRNAWLKQLHLWHWISAAVSLTGMLGFAITGITLNHAASIGAEPVVTHGQGTLPASLMPALSGSHAENAPLPAPVAAAVAKAVPLDPTGLPADWSDDSAVTVEMPGPGRDAWVSIDRSNGQITSEVTKRGAISYLNDLHKGRNTGPWWSWFIDIFAGACVLFTLTGLLLLQMHARHRPMTWPLVAAGVAIPVILALFLIH